MTALNKQAQAIISDIRLKHGSGDAYAPIIRWDEFEVVTSALEAAEKRIAEHNFENQLLANADRDIKALRQRIAELESLPVPPVMYSENSDADHCRQQAWKQVKDEVSTDGWSTSDSVNYFGFFCWGWDARRQYNEQRPTTVTLPEVRITVAESKRKNLTWRELGAYNEGADVAKEAILAVIRSAGIGVKGE